MGELVNIQSLVLQTINIFIIVWVLWKFFFKQYLTYLDEEAKKRSKLNKDMEESHNILKNAHIEAAKIRDESRLDAKNIANEIVETARRDADALRMEAMRDAELARKKWFADIEHERKVLAEEMKKRVLDVAIKMNEKLFGKSESNEQFLRNSHKDITF